MKSRINPSPINPATKLLFNESEPRIASTVRSWIKLIGNGRRPDSSKRAKSWTLS